MRKQLDECINAYLVSAVNMFVSCLCVSLKVCRPSLNIRLHSMQNNTSELDFYVCACKTRSHHAVVGGCFLILVKKQPTPKFQVPPFLVFLIFI